MRKPHHTVHVREAEPSGTVPNHRCSILFINGAANLASQFCQCQSVDKYTHLNSSGRRLDLSNPSVTRFPHSPFSAAVHDTKLNGNLRVNHHCGLFSMHQIAIVIPLARRDISD